LLFAISSGIEVSEKTIDKITKGNVGEQVKINGMIEKITELNSTTFITVVQPNDMTVVVFKKEKRNLSLSEGDYVEVIGKVDEYGEELEVIAQRIRKVS